MRAKEIDGMVIILIFIRSKLLIIGGRWSRFKNNGRRNLAFNLTLRKKKVK